MTQLNQPNQISATKHSDGGADSRQTLVKWVAAIADNLKNPIAGIGAAINLIEHEIHAHAMTNQFDDTLVDAGIAKVRERLKSLDEYVTELIDFARPAVIDPDSISLRTAFDRVTSELKGKMPVGAVFTLDVEDRHCPSVYADENKLVASLKALALNAFEALGAAGTPVIRIVAEKSSAPSKGTLIKFGDNGPGFTEEAKRRALEPFFSTREAGTGLGLAIVRKNVEAHRGTMTIASSPSGGALITLFFPDRGAS